CFLNDTPTTEIYSLSLHDAFPIFYSHYLYSTCLLTRLSHTKDLNTHTHTHHAQIHTHTPCANTHTHTHTPSAHTYTHTHTMHTTHTYAHTHACTHPH